MQQFIWVGSLAGDFWLMLANFCSFQYLHYADCSASAVGLRIHFLSSVANFLWTCTLKCKSFSTVIWPSLHSDCLITSREVTGFASNSTRADAFHCRASWPSAARAAGKAGGMLQWRTYICRTRHLTLVGPFHFFSPVKNNLLNNLLEKCSDRSVLYLLFCFLEAGGKGGVMHSPVAHVLYLCHPEMKHLCGDGFLLRNLIKF